MLQHVEMYHCLETRERRSKESEWMIWRPAEAGMYREAYLLAHHGHLSEAIELAEKTRIAEYGDMHNVDFRCVTKQRTVTLRAGVPSEDRIAR